MKVRALKSFGGSQGHRAAGSIFELPEGADWIKAGLVEPVIETAAKKSPARKRTVTKRKATKK